jgi:hypothetical protein
MCREAHADTALEAGIFLGIFETEVLGNSFTMGILNFV